jgi:hypothetical protein
LLIFGNIGVPEQTPESFVGDVKYAKTVLKASMGGRGENEIKETILLNAVESPKEWVVNYTHFLVRKVYGSMNRITD